MYRYTAYGLNVTSDLPLPELTEARQDCDAEVTIRRERIHLAVGRGNPDALLLWATPTDVGLRYSDTAVFRIRDGRHIDVEPVEGADDRVVRLLLLGPALAVLLHQRGSLVLHASAVALASGVAAFVADKGEGKSTLAAALHARGHSVVADDFIAIQLDDPHVVRVRAGYPQLKLSPEVLKQLGEEPEAMPRVHPDFDKRARRVDDADCGAALPLVRIYVLEGADVEAIDSLSPQQRFVELVRHSYLAALLEPTGERSAHFNQVVALASRVPVLRLRRRRDLSLLAQVAQFVEADVQPTR
jgi:hypothetical protein